MVSGWVEDIEGQNGKDKEKKDGVFIKKKNASYPSSISLLRFLSYVHMDSSNAQLVT